MLRRRIRYIALIVGDGLDSGARSVHRPKLNPLTRRRNNSSIEAQFKREGAMTDRNDSDLEETEA